MRTYIKLEKNQHTVVVVVMFGSHDEQYQTNRGSLKSMSEIGGK